MKTCTKCGETKPVTEFYKQTRNRDGLRPSCKSCVKSADAQYRAANPEMRKANSYAWYAANKEKKNAASSKWQKENPERVNAILAKHHALNADKIKTIKAAWKKANPEACRIHVQNRRARKREAGGKLSSGLAERLFDLQRGKCACGCRQPLGNDYHLDHRMPLALGGTNTDDNMQLLTATCNMQKHAKHPVDFMQQRGFLL